MRSRLRRIACLGLIAGLVAGPAFAADTANGSKNFRAPPSVPNFFSNEAGPMLGPAVETQRGVIYSGQPVAAIRDPTGITAARARQHIAMAEPRGRLIRGRHDGPVVAHHVAVHGRPTYHVATHGSSRSHTTYVSAGPRRPAAAHSTRTISRTTRVSVHRGRG
jgi:hypothetical protein